MAESVIKSSGDWIELGSSNTTGQVNINGKFSNYKTLAFILEQKSGNVSRSEFQPYIVSTSIFKRTNRDFDDRIEGSQGGSAFYYVSDTAFYINTNAHSYHTLVVYGIT
jgi:hypothetical protein